MVRWKWWYMLQRCRWQVGGCSEEKQILLIRKELWICAIQTMMLMTTPYVWRTCVRFFCHLFFHCLFCFLWLGGLAWSDIINSVFSVLWILLDLFLHGCDDWRGHKAIQIEMLHRNAFQIIGINTTYQRSDKQACLWTPVCWVIVNCKSLLFGCCSLGDVKVVADSG